MSSTFGGFNTVVRGLYAQQAALDTVGHNVSNANTDGYSRQRVNLVTTSPGIIFGTNGVNQVGSGVIVQSVTRARDSFVDRQYWKESSTLGFSKAQQDSLGKIEGIFNDTGNSGIQSVLNKFWDSLQVLSTNAADVGVRTGVREQGVILVNTIQHSAQQLKDMVTDINSNIDIKVNSINQISSELASLNKQIRTIESGGTDHANDLRDKRDFLVDQLSSLVDVRATETQDGTYTVQSGSVFLVNGDDFQKLTTSTPIGTTTTDPDYGYEIKNIYTVGDYQPANFTNGEVKGLIDMRDSQQFGVKGYLDNLSTISQFLLQDFNQVHRSGYGTDNSTNNNFFGTGGATDPDFTTATVSGGFTKNDWIKNLQINQDLFDAATGLAKIAAKSAGASIGVTKSNSNGGSAAVFATGTYTGGNVPTLVKTSLNGTTGNITSIDYITSNDGGATWSSPTNVVGSGPYNVTISGLVVTMNISDNANNNPGDTYSYTLDKNTAISSIAVTQSNPIGGGGTITSATGTYMKGDTATAVMVKPFDAAATSIVVATGQIKQVKYSIDGGANWSVTPTTVNADGTFSIPVNGIAVKLQIATNINNAATDQYNFTLSKGNVASGDNAVLLGNRLKTDTIASLGNASLDGYYSSMISGLGVQSQNATRLTDNQSTLVNQVISWRDSVSGVNMDEEMANMIRYQKGYSAAARVLTTMDEMLDKLINGTGMVGR